MERLSLNNDFSFDGLGYRELDAGLSGRSAQNSHIPERYSTQFSPTQDLRAGAHFESLLGGVERCHNDNRYRQWQASTRNQSSRASWCPSNTQQNGFDFVQSRGLEVIAPQSSSTYSISGWETESRWPLSGASTPSHTTDCRSQQSFYSVESRRGINNYRSHSFNTATDYERGQPMRDMEDNYRAGMQNDWSATQFGSQHSVAPKSNPIKRQQQQNRDNFPIDGFIYQVQFKRAHRNYILSPSAPRDIIPGDFVKVEADRGEDMGVVLAKIPVECFEEVTPTAGFRGRGFSSGQGEKKYLFRRASKDERTALKTKVDDEEHALETIRQKVQQKGFPMKVLEAEYQFDRHKLTFYFEAENRIDFRDLVSELFSQYKTRIWMQQVDPTSINVHDVGTELARSTGFIPARHENEDFFSSKRSSFSQSDDTTKASSIGINSLIDHDPSADDAFYNSPSSDVSLEDMLHRAPHSDIWDFDVKL